MKSSKLRKPPFAGFVIFESYMLKSRFVRENGHVLDMKGATCANKECFSVPVTDSTEIWVIISEGQVQIFA